MTEWIEICALEEIPAQGTRVLESGKGRVGLFRTDADEVFALADRCPHKGGHLSQGMVCGQRVTCPMHGWSIGLQDGTAAAPDVGKTDTYPVKIEGGMVFVQI